MEIDVEDILNRLDLEIEGERGDWADILCPFHPEGRPSFSINMDTGVWICRHGENTGNIIGIIEEVKKLTKREAYEWLENLPPYVATDTELIETLYNLGKEVIEEHPEIDNWCKTFDSIKWGRMSEYWFERGFTVESMRMFNVKFNEEDNSIFWPVIDEFQETKGFIKRYVPPLRGPKKYDYPLGFKRILFPLNHFAGEHVLLVEGGLDAIWLHQHGWRSALAVLGSGLTRTQREWIYNNAKRVTILFDNDRAGKEGAIKVASQLKGMLVRIGDLPEGFKDVQEMSSKEIMEAISFAKLQLIGQKEV